MKDILRLSKLELNKILKTNIAKIAILIAVVIMCGLTVSEYSDIKRYKELESSGELTSEGMDWREREQDLIENTKEAIEDPYYNEIQREQMLRRIEIAQYRLDKDIDKDIYKNMWWFFNDNSFDWVFRFIILVVIIVGAYNIASEYDKRTINFWMISQHKRWKILLSKYIASFVYGLGVLWIVFVLGMLSGLIIHGFNGWNIQQVLYGANGPYAINIALYSVVVVLLKLVELIFSVTLTTMIAVVLKSTTFATITGIITIFIAAPFVLIASSYSRIYQYLPFNQLDFRRYLDYGTVMPTVYNDFENVIVKGITPITSVLILCAYMAIFISTTYYFFCKRDVI